MSQLDQFVKECHHNLINDGSEETNAARIYLKKRNINSDTLITHQVGYCHRGQYIPDEVKYYGVRDDEERSKSGYAFFMNGRLIVPVYSEFGDVVGLATRKPTFEPGNSWWNLPKPFKKGQHLFLLDKARKAMFDKNRVVIVEGYIDALQLYQAGLQEVVAIMGTKLTPRKIGLIARYCDNICLCLDVDANMSGQKGQQKAIYALREHDFYDTISVIDGIPVGEDPDIFVAKNGLNALLSMERELSSIEIEKIWKEVRSQL